MKIGNVKVFKIIVQLMALGFAATAFFKMPPQTGQYNTFSYLMGVFSLLAFSEMNVDGLNQNVDLDNHKYLRIQMSWVGKIFQLLFFVSGGFYIVSQF